MTYSKVYSSLLIFFVIIFACNSIRSTAAATSNVRPNDNSHRLHTRPYLRLAQRPLSQYSRLKDEFLGNIWILINIACFMFLCAIYLDDDELFELNKRQTSDDYGHLRFGKRDEFDDYGHMRFGRSGPDATN